MIKMLLGLLFVSAVCAGEIVKDTETGLVWQNNEEMVKKDWDGAKAYCKSLKLEGYSDWRLANINELKKVSKKCKYNHRKKHLLKNAPSNYYWTASKVEKYKNKNRAWVVLFNEGYTNWRSTTNNNFVRCVRADKK